MTENIKYKVLMFLQIWENIGLHMIPSKGLIDKINPISLSINPLALKYKAKKG